jgi:hypothetical protein
VGLKVIRQNRWERFDREELTILHTAMSALVVIRDFQEGSSPCSIGDDLREGVELSRGAF